MEDEINVLEDIRDFSMFFGEDGEEKRVIRKALKKYVDSVINKEWEQMAHNKSMDSDTSPELYELMGAINKIKIQDPRDEVALGVMMGKIGDITTYRTKRINLSNEKLPPLLKFLVFLMSFIVVAGFIFTMAESLFVNLFMTISTTLSVGLTYFVISDLDTPFFGSWNINSNSWFQLNKRLSRETE